MRAEKQKSPAPRDQRGQPGANLKPQNDITSSQSLQSICYLSAAILRDVEERCLAALWCDPSGGYLRVIRAGLCDAEQFAFPEHRELFRALMSYGALLIGEPTVETIGDMVRRVFDRSFIGLDGRDDLPRLRWMETTSAGLENYARAVVKAHRKRRQLARIIDKGISIARDPLASEWMPKPAPAPELPRQSFSEQVLTKLGRGRAPATPATEKPVFSARTLARVRARFGRGDK